MDSESHAWFAALGHGLVPAMRRVHDIILGADPRMTAYHKYGTVHFAYQGDMAAFVQQKDDRRISLMFNRGAAIPGDFPHLEGDGKTARFLRFADLADVEAKANELRRIARAWCELRSRS